MPDTETTGTLTAALDEIREAEKAATGGPWHLITDSCDCGGDYPCSHGSFPYAIVTPQAHFERDDADPFREHDYQHSEIGELTMEDAEFIVAARSDVPRLLAALDEVLKLARSWDEIAAQLHAAAAGDTASNAPTKAARSMIASTRQATAKEVREAISRALLGEEGSDA